MLTQLLFSFVLAGNSSQFCCAFSLLLCSLSRYHWVWTSRIPWLQPLLAHCCFYGHSLLCSSLPPTHVHLVFGLGFHILYCHSLLPWQLDPMSSTGTAGCNSSASLWKNATREHSCFLFLLFVYCLLLTPSPFP